MEKRRGKRAKKQRIRTRRDESLAGLSDEGGGAVGGGSVEEVLLNRGRVC